jgi:hypothetical protein
MIIVGAGVVARADAAALLKKLHAAADKCGVVKPGWNGFNLLHDAAGRVAALDVGFRPSAAAKKAAAKVGEKRWWERREGRGGVKSARGDTLRALAGWRSELSLGDAESLAG